jgi:hypothetical protein
MALAKSTLATPPLLNQAGGLLSNFHDSVPLPPWASMNTTMCGFTQSSFVTVPVSVNLLDISNMADGEWCAHKDPAAERPIRTIKATEILRKAGLLSNAREYITADYWLINVVDRTPAFIRASSPGRPKEELRQLLISSRIRLAGRVPEAKGWRWRSLPAMLRAEKRQGDRAED